MLEAAPSKLTSEQVQALFRRYGPFVARRCRALLKHPNDAEDACQEVFVRLLRSSEDFEGRSEWMTWLYRVATNLCLNRIRDRARRDAGWYAAFRAELPSAAPSPESRVFSAQLLDLCLREQTETDRQIAVLHFLDGMAQGEIADVVGLSRATVNKRLQQLRDYARSVDATPGEKVPTP